MSNNDNYCLRLNEFEENSKIYWQELQTEKDFFDVTLACEDKQIMAHKLVLSSCSPVLRNILKINQTPHPVIYLRRVKYKELQNLLNFMYQGEVNVAEEDLSNFLEIAEDFNVRGLCERNTEVNPSNGKANSQVINQKVLSSSKRKGTENERVGNINDSNGDSLERINSKHGDNLESMKYNSGDSFPNNDIDLKTFISPKEIPNGAFNLICNENTQNIYSVAVQDVGESHQCGQCGYSTKRKFNLTSHIKSIHEGERYPCTQCSYKATTKPSLIHHVKSIHEGVHYPCYQCDYKASKPSRLRSHQFKYHN